VKISEIKRNGLWLTITLSHLCTLRDDAIARKTKATFYLQGARLIFSDTGRIRSLMVVLHSAAGPRPQDVQQHPEQGGVCPEATSKGLRGSANNQGGGGDNPRV
jgi:hypothetical protein